MKKHTTQGGVLLLLLLVWLRECLLQEEGPAWQVRAGALRGLGVFTHRAPSAQALWFRVVLANRCQY